MKIRYVLTFLLMAAFLSGLFCFTSCQNGNIFGGIHDRGGSGDPKALLNDADLALRSGDFSRALSLYNRVLATDPNNAKALYGSSAALLGTAGLNVGVLITNVMKQASGTDPINGLGDLIKDSRIGFSAVTPTENPNSLLSGINKESLDTVLNEAICKLQKIVSGATDGSISPNDTDVLVNLATLCIIRAAVRPILAGYIDIINDGNGNFSIVDQTGNTQAAFCGDPSNKALIQDMATDVASAYALFNRAVNNLGLSSDRLIFKLRHDVDTVISSILSTSPATLDSACRDLITQPQPGGLGFTNASDFQNYLGIFTPLTSGC